MMVNQSSSSQYYTFPQPQSLTFTFTLTPTRTHTHANPPPFSSPKVFVGGQRVVVCTDVDGKDDAILAVTEIARATGPHFVQFIDRVFEPLSAACRSFFSEEVRTLAISSMGALLEVRACVRACVCG